ncbi:hypothetical protein [Streptomyces sp. NPDC007369]|uniref:hypothetical protein n=1 Tax=Streptomyces sp. NPDC007369 TaxID=3154589 RepID=UPI0033E8B0CA
MSSPSFTPPRLLILAAPAGIYPTISLAPELGWDWSAGTGALLFCLVLFGPAFLKWAAKENAARAALKRAEAKAKAEEKGGKK